MDILHIFLIFSFCYATLADNSCKFEHPIRGVIDLSSIGFRNGQPRFRNLSSIPDAYYTYSFNPCYSFTELGCTNAAICQQSHNRIYSNLLATQNASYWSVDSKNIPVLTYTNTFKTVSISMICSSTVEDRLEIIGENPSNHYSMRLHSHCACWNGCIRPAPISTTTTQRTPYTTNVIYSSACRYYDSRYGTIDLSSIGSMTGTPIFKDVPSIYTNDYLWSYNPCYKFSERSCHNVSGCQIHKTRFTSETIGLQQLAYWTNMNDKSYPLRSIIYPSTVSNRRLIVQLICDRSISTHRLEVYGETTVGEYMMQLTSPCACWDGCINTPPYPPPFDWDFWIIAGSIGAGVFLLSCILISCLFCSKPQRMIIDEKTPFINYKA